MTSDRKTWLGVVFCFFTREENCYFHIMCVSLGAPTWKYDFKLPFEQAVLVGQYFGSTCFSSSRNLPTCAPPNAALSPSTFIRKRFWETFLNLRSVSSLFNFSWLSPEVCSLRVRENFTCSSSKVEVLGWRKWFVAIILRFLLVFLNSFFSVVHVCGAACRWVMFRIT